MLIETVGEVGMEDRRNIPLGLDRVVVGCPLCTGLCSLGLGSSFRGVVMDVAVSVAIFRAMDVVVDVVKFIAMGVTMSVVMGVVMDVVQCVSILSWRRYPLK